MLAIKSKLARTALLLIATVLLLSAMARLVSANLALKVDPDAPTAAAQPSIPTDELAQLIGQVLQREAAVAIREAEAEEAELQLEEAKRTIEESLNTLAAAEAALEARMFSSNSAAETDIVSLVAIYENMKPKDAASLFETMDPDFAAGFLARMSPENAAAIFSNLSPLVAYAISALIAGRNSNAITESSQ